MTARRRPGWHLERTTAPAARLLEPWPPIESDDAPVVRVGRMIGRRALVLGSTQDARVLDRGRAEAAGIDVIRRETGGGAVLVAPEAQVWLDFWIPRHDDLWDDDVITAAGWVGRTWVKGLESLGARSLHVHHGPATRTAWSDLVCFAGLGPGEVRVGPERSTAPKVMGLAQRRTRRGARFHTSAPLVWDPRPLLELLEVDPPVDAPAELDGLAVGLRALALTVSDEGDGAVVGAVEDAVIAALP